MVEAFQAVLANKLMVAPALAWICAQVLKTVIDWARTGSVSLRLLVGAGGMPSAHSALVTALATAVGVTQGLDTAIFAVTAMLAAVVMYDAAGVRQAVDRQSKVLTHLLVQTPPTHRDFDRFLEELVGHTRVQVAAGALVGLAVALVYV
jgi:acid phosphatase family membrane protein YuiD